MLKRTTALLVATCAAMVAASGAAHAATFAVDRTDDNPPAQPPAPAAPAPTCTPAPSDCTLRDAINAANADTTQPNTVTLPAVTVRVTDALPPITNGLTIAGSGARTSVIDGANTPGGVLLTDNVNVVPLVVRDLTIRHLGTDASPTIGIETLGTSGAANDQVPNPSLQLDHVAITDSASTPIVLGTGTLSVQHSLLARNRTIAGVILNVDATMTIADTTIAANTPVPTAAGQAQAAGSGIVNLCHATITSSTIANNTSNSGSTFLNGAPIGANLTSVDLGVPGLPCTDIAMRVSSSIVAGDSANEDCSGTITDGGNNVSTDFDDSCSFTAPSDRVNVDPLLGALRNNGGPTDTLALLAGSPAIDAGVGCAATDQRGLPRPLGVACDSGAFESAFTTAPVVAGATASSGPTATTVATPPPVDRTPAKLTVTGIPRHVTRNAFNAGLKLRVAANEAIAADLSLFVVPVKVTIARARPLSLLASRSLGRSAATRTLILHPSRKLARHGHAVSAQLRVVAYDAAGNRTAKTIAFTVR